MAILGLLALGGLIAGIVLAAKARSGSSVVDNSSSGSTPGIPSNYTNGTNSSSTTG